MGFRFRQSIKIAPGIKLNVGKKSASVSVGGKGASLNFSKKGTRGTVGVPGTGLSYSKFKKHDQQKNSDNSGLGTLIVIILIISIAIMIFSK